MSSQNAKESQHMSLNHATAVTQQRRCVQHNVPTPATPSSALGSTGGCAGNPLKWETSRRDRQGHTLTQE
ncbi:hypothetical protein E2C01_071059 [Portunus trituberculatus]|uniref:Uncharacterized protein n=1 Tax=Portunus trituberculatus TaxID=210409 RepID=A0A5B7HUE7_PORTR|nr:hypothetical protein [Portunus trituberculatus]